MADKNVTLTMRVKDKLSSPIQALGAVISKVIAKKAKDDVGKLAAAFGASVKQTHAATIASQKLGLEAAKAFGDFVKQTTAAAVAMQKMEAQSRTLGARVGRALSFMKQNWLALTAGIAAAMITINKVVGAIKNVVNAALEEQRTFDNLRNTIEAYGGSWEKAESKVHKMAKAVESLTRYSDDQAASALQTLVSITGDYGIAQDNLILTLGLAEQKHLDVDAAAKYVGMALKGNFIMLGRLVPELRNMDDVLGKDATSADKVTYAMGILNGKFKDSAINARDAAKGLAQLKHQQENIEEAIGMKTLPLISRLGTEWLGVLSIIEKIISKQKGIGKDIGKFNTKEEIEAELERIKTTPVRIPLLRPITGLRRLGEVAGRKELLENKLESLKFLEEESKGEEKRLREFAKSEATKESIKKAVDEAEKKRQEAAQKREPYTLYKERLKQIDDVSKATSTAYDSLDEHYERAQAKASLLESAIRSLRENGYSLESKEIKELSAEYLKYAEFQDKAKTAIKAKEQAIKDAADAQAEADKKAKESAEELNKTIEESQAIWNDFQQSKREIEMKAGILGWTKEEIDAEMQSLTAGTLDRAIAFASTPEGAKVGMQGWIDELAAGVRAAKADELATSLAEKQLEAAKIAEDKLKEGKEFAAKTAAEAMAAAIEKKKKDESAAADLASAKLANEIAALERGMIADVKTAADVEFNLAQQRLIIEKQIAEIKEKIAGETAPAEKERLLGEKVALEAKIPIVVADAEKQKQQIKDAATTTYFEVEGALSAALRDGFEGGDVIKSFADKLKSSVLDAVSDALAKAVMGGSLNLGFGGGGLTGTAGGAGGKGGGIGGLLGGGAGSILGYAGLAYGIYSMFQGKAEKAPIARPETPETGVGGGEFGGQRPLYGSRRMQLAQFSSRNAEGALHRMAAEGPVQVHTSFEVVDKTSTGTAIRNVVVKQMSQERRRGLRRHEY